MGWSLGYDENWKRDIGYGVPSMCDHPGCGTLIDRGISHVCGYQPYGGERGCGLFFCAKHLTPFAHLCERCEEGKDPFTPTIDTEEWTRHKATHPSWAKWREEQTRERETMIRRRMPNGEETTSFDEYAAAWHKLSQPLEDKLGLVLRGYDKGFAYSHKSQPHLSLELPQWFVELLADKLK